MMRILIILCFILPGLVSGQMSNRPLHAVAFGVPTLAVTQASDTLEIVTTVSWPAVRPNEPPADSLVITLTGQPAFRRVLTDRTQTQDKVRFAAPPAPEGAGSGAATYSWMPCVNAFRTTPQRGVEIVQACGAEVTWTVLTPLVAPTISATIRQVFP